MSLPLLKIPRPFPPHPPPPTPLTSSTSFGNFLPLGQRALATLTFCCFWWVPAGSSSRGFVCYADAARGLLPCPVSAGRARLNHPPRQRPSCSPSLKCAPSFCPSSVPPYFPGSTYHYLKLSFLICLPLLLPVSSQLNSSLHCWNMAFLVLFTVEPQHLG